MRNKAFTLVELLVVIAVIGLLASIVFVSLRGARDKARIAAGMQFGSSVHHALGAYAVGIWDFDDQTANDSSGNNNNGTPNGATLRCASADDSYTPSGKGCSYEFDGNDTINIVNPGNLNITESITIETWIKTASLYSSNYGVILMGNVLDLSWLAVSDARVDFRLRIGGVMRVKQSTTTLSTDTWYHVVTTWDGSTMKIYIDGKEDSSAGPYAGVLSLTTGALVLGSYPGTYFFSGFIDNIRVYDEALSSTQINELYVEEAAFHKNNLTNNY